MYLSVATIQITGKVVVTVSAPPILTKIDKDIFVNITSSYPTYEMGGYGFTYTPSKSGNLVALLLFAFSVNVINQGCRFRLKHGTGAAPATGAAETGTTDYDLDSFLGNTASIVLPLTLTGLLTGLTLGTPIWIDVAAAVGGANTITLDHPLLILVEF